ncbi:MAG: hypothetical protein ACTSQQ_03625, partial [Candidatus Helarchaeota archaeon]
HVPMHYAVAGEPITISMEIDDEFGVSSVMLYYRANGSTGAYGALSLVLNGDPTNGIWYGSIPAINVTAAGLEYYLWATDIGSNSKYYGNVSAPFVITVFGKIIEVPLMISIISIVAVCAVAIFLYIYLPEYQGEETK